jgi:UDP-glucose 6-dehydrogenase
LLIYDKNTKIGIVGVGVAGGALERCFRKSGVEPLVYDKYKNLGSAEKVKEAEIIFVAAPTPFDEKIGFDLSAVGDVFELLREAGEKTMVIKSTVLPGTTDAMQKKYPQHKVLFNPEFLAQARADHDTAFPDRQIVGCTKESQGMASEIMEILPPAPLQKIIPAKEAELVK